MRVALAADGTLDAHADAGKQSLATYQCIVPCGVAAAAGWGSMLLSR